MITGAALRRSVPLYLSWATLGLSGPLVLNKCPGCFQKIHIIAYHLELTVPWEERMEEEHERKKVNYQPLLDACQRQGWDNWNLPLEVDSRGFAGHSVVKAYRVLSKETGNSRCLQASTISFKMVMADERAAVDSLSVSGRGLTCPVTCT